MAKSAAIPVVRPGWRRRVLPNASKRGCPRSGSRSQRVLSQAIRCQSVAVYSHWHNDGLGERSRNSWRKQWDLILKLEVRGTDNFALRCA